MVNMLMVMICSMCVLPSREGPCWSSVLNSCRTRLTTPGKDSMLYRQIDRHSEKYRKTDTNTSFRSYSLSFKLIQSLNFRAGIYERSLTPLSWKAFHVHAGNLEWISYLAGEKKEKAKRRNLLLLRVLFSYKPYSTAHDMKTHVLVQGQSTRRGLDIISYFISYESNL